MPADPAMARHAALHVARVLRGAGHTAYFAGGCVRDELLGAHPTDYDVATEAEPDAVQALFRSTAHVGVSFGVVLVRLTPKDLGGLRGTHTVEVATFRSDGAYTDKRRPDSVVFAGEIEDAHRRDFTVNALYLDPLAEPDASGAGGRLIDHVGGLADLRDGVIRAVGEPGDRLAEDHLRALRGVRFAARLGFTIEPGTRDAIARDAAGLAGVSRERIGDEIRRMLRHPSRAAACSLLRQLDLESTVLGPLPDRRGASLFESVAALPPDASFPAGLAAWLIDRGGTGAEAQRRLCLSNDEFDRTLDIIDTVARVRHDWPRLGVAQRKRLAARTGYQSAITILAASEPEAVAAVERDVRELAAADGGLAPDPLVRGADLIAAGLEPGPMFGRILDQVYDAQLEGRIRTAGEGLDMARSMARGEAKNPGTGGDPMEPGSG